MAKDEKTLSEQVQDLKENSDSTQADQEDKGGKPEATKKEKPKATRKFEPSELVEIMNNSPGSLYYKSKKTGLEWKLEKHGDTDWMEVQELQTMRSSQPSFFQHAWVKVLDDEAVEFLRLGHFYKDVLEKPEIEDLLMLDRPSELEHIIDTAPMSVKILILHTARELIEDGRLTNAHVIKVIERKYQVVLLEDDAE